MPVLLPGQHIGVVVADLDKAMAELTRSLGLEWLDPVRSGHQATGVGTPEQGPMVTFSRQGPVHFELLEQTPNTIWDTPGLHHIGFWAADAKGESDRFAAAGFPLEAAAVVLAGETEPGVFYHRTSDGLSLELCELSRAGTGFAYYLNGATSKV